jgi:hypothetical protein
MANEKNLKPFIKGQISNPNGRPKKLPALDLIMANVMGQEKTASRRLRQLS